MPKMFGVFNCLIKTSNTFNYQSGARMELVNCRALYMQEQVFFLCVVVIVSMITLWSEYRQFSSYGKVLQKSTLAGN
jgi:hypothetical protein